MWWALKRWGGALRCWAISDLGPVRLTGSMLILSVATISLLGHGTAAEAASLPTAPVDRPFVDDPLHLVAYRSITSAFHTSEQTWKVYSCDTPLTGRVPSDAAAVQAWSAPVTSWMGWVSEGRYHPRFVASGRISGKSRLDCAAIGAARLADAERRARTGIIVLHDEFAADEGGAYGLSVPAAWSQADGTLVLDPRERPPRVTLTGGGVDEEWRWSLVAHEIGHTLGWNHVPYQDGSSYGNANDIMSGIRGVGTAAWNRYAAGWMDPGYVEIHRYGKVTYRLGGVGSDNTQMVVVPGPEVGTLYTVSARVVGPYDGADTAGVEVHRIDQTLRPGQSGCARHEGAGACFGTATAIEAIVPPGSVEYEPASWQAGDVVKIGSVRVEVTAADANGFTVVVDGKAPPLWKADAAPIDPAYDPPTQPTDPPEADPVAPPKLDSQSGPSGRFVDVPSDHVHAEAIEWLAEHGITAGCNPPTNDEFCPEGALTRGQMAAFLLRALDLDRAQPAFVDGGGVFSGDIGGLAAAGVTAGCNPPVNDRYCPDALVTRGQMAAFLVRALDLPSGEARFEDVAGSDFARDIAALAGAGITSGCNPPDNDRFCPDQAITRAEMAAFLHRALSS